jgi:hypothetical protein
MWRFYLILFSALAVFMPELSGQGIERADFLSPNANQFLDQLPAPLSAAAEKIYPDGTIVLSPSSSASQPSLLQMIESPAGSSFTLARESKSRFDSQAVYRRYQQYHHGIKVDGGGYTAKLVPGQDGSLRLERFAPHVFYGIDVPLEPTVGQQALSGILGVPAITAAKLIISDRYGGGFLLLWEVSYADGEPKHALINAHSGDIVHSYSGVVGLNGTTETYGLQPLNDFEQGGVTYMATPNQQIKVYEFSAMPNDGFETSPWPDNLIPVTSGATWDGAASAHAIQVLYTTNLVMPSFSGIGIDFGAVHAAVSDDFGANTWVTSNMDVASLHFGRLQAAPTALFDVVAHELGHCFMLSGFLGYDDWLGNISLQEGIADIFGAYIESLIQEDGADWVMGDDEPAVALFVDRDLSVLACLENMEFEGPHRRGTVIGHWYFALSEGMPAASSHGPIDALGMDAALDILLESLNGLSNPNAGFPEMRAQTLIAAAQQYGACSREYASVVNAWERVCVPGYSEPCPCGLEIVAPDADCGAGMRMLYAEASGIAPFAYSWSTGATGDAISVAQPSVYSITITDWQGCTAQASYSLEQGANIYINTSVEYSGDQHIIGDIVIGAGGLLTVTGTLRFGEGQGIVVNRGGKLDLKGGTLTRCPGANDWRGINVEGNLGLPQPDAFGMPSNDEAGVVLMRGGASVEWARTAISTTRLNEWWDEPYWGGLVHCENTIFKDNRRAAEFMKYGHSNQSRFINCTIDGGTEGYAGVTIWATDGITFNRCRFYNMSQYGILAYDAGVIVKEANDFIGNRVGISSQATYPYSGFAVIGEFGVAPNYFYGNREHIVSNATAFGPGLSIINNEMFNAQVAAVRIVGPSQYDVINNQIAGAIVGLNLLRGGSLTWRLGNRVEDNTFSSFVGINAVGENREMQFLCNSFSSSLFDFRVLGDAFYGDGAIRAQQGNLGRAAGNCFTEPGQQIDILTLGPTLSFDYYVGSPLACKTPLNPGNYSVEQATGDDCENQPPKETPDLTDLQDIKAEIQAILDGGGTMEDVPYALLEAQRYALSYLVNEAMRQGDEAGALLLLNGESLPFAQLMKYGIAARTGDFSMAQAVLDALPTGDAEMGAFKQVQAINLARLQQGLAYELSQGDSLFLEGIAQSELGVKAYARSILGLLAGRMFEDDEEFPGMPQMQSGIGGAAQAPQAAARIRVFPNPAQSQFTLSLPVHIEEAVLQLHSPLGQLLHQQAVMAGENIIGLEGRAAAGGLVLVRVLGNQGEALHTQLLVVH